ncbi:MAG: carboxypeptidase-like regulatory domain-containing protein, partial [Gemmatimonadales bacterium]
MKTLGRWFALVVMLIAVPLVRLAAQAASSVIKGRILMAEPRRPIAGARIVLVGTPHSATTDSRGTFAFEGLDAGPYTIQASAIGFTTLSSPLLLKERETLEVEFVAHAEAANLPDLVVEEENRNEPADWNRWRTEGQGRYITRAQLENRRVATLPDALRIIPG